MPQRILEVTTDTTCDHVAAGAVGHGWSEDAVGVLDVESPVDEAIVRLGVELDPTAVEELVKHAVFARLSPDQARRLAAELEAVADAAERGERVSSDRGRVAVGSAPSVLHDCTVTSLDRNA